MHPSERDSTRNRITSRATKQALADIQTAARAGNATLFFNSARAALQQALALRRSTIRIVPAAEVRALLQSARAELKNSVALPARAAVCMSASACFVAAT